MNRILLICLTGTLFSVGTAWSGPLFDPFLERFQVGTYRDPAEMEMLQGFPEDLLDPPLLDPSWMLAAHQVLDAREGAADSFLTRRLLANMEDQEFAENWLKGMGHALDHLDSGTASGFPESDAAPFSAARSAREVFTLLESGRVMQAAALTLRLRDQGQELGLSPREIFVWDLRAKRLIQKAGNRPSAGGSSWYTMLDLGPFDKGSAWAVWMAYCRTTDTTPLPTSMHSEQWGRHLSGIGNPRLTPKELYASGLSSDFKAGLGAVFFKGETRKAHFQKYPIPPEDNSLQGLWVRGRRLQSRGDPVVYEQLAARTDLKAAWRMDVWRRASESRLLKGQWDQGLSNLERALEIAHKGHGHRSTRRRLRQWNEQALVLALAKDDLTTALQLHELGLKYFQGEELAAFRTETDHWIAYLGGDDLPSQPESADSVEAARLVVESGRVKDLGPAGSERKAKFSTASTRKLWDLWIRWGEVLANPEPVQGVKRERAIEYGQALAAMKTLVNPAHLESAVLGLVSRRLAGSPVFNHLLEQAFDHDVGLASNWSVAPDPSPVPELMPLVRGSELDRHALLGFALAAGDMRGILAVAYELEGRGLTLDEKRLFLYPLPAQGAIYEAIAAADSDPALLLAVARNESLFEPSVRSRAGALGWMQIMPFHYEDNGALAGKQNWRHPGVSIRKGDSLLRENSKRFQGNPYQAVAAYNAGAGAASRWETQLGGSPSRDIYLAWIGYPETRHYVEKVLIDREIYDGIIRAHLPE